MHYILKGGDRTCLGRRKGHVQRRHKKASPGQFYRSAKSQANESERGPADAAHSAVAENRRLSGDRAADVKGCHGFYIP